MFQRYPYLKYWPFAVLLVFLIIILASVNNSSDINPGTLSKSGITTDLPLTAQINEPTTIGQNGQPTDTTTDRNIDVEEGIADSPSAEDQSLTDRLAKYTWSDILPAFTAHFSIYYKEGPGLDIVLESKNTDEFAQYKEEALAWAKDHNIPVDTLSVDVNYRQQ